MSQCNMDQNAAYVFKTLSVWQRQSHLANCWYCLKRHASISCAFSDHAAYLICDCTNYLYLYFYSIWISNMSSFRYSSCVLLLKYVHWTQYSLTMAPFLCFDRWYLVFEGELHSSQFKASLHAWPSNAVLDSNATCYCAYLGIFYSYF